MYQRDYKKEIFIIITSFSIFALVSMMITLFNFYELKSLDNFTKQMYDRALKVSNGVLLLRVEVSTIHKDMKDIYFEDIEKKIQKHHESIVKTLDEIELILKDPYSIQAIENIKKAIMHWKSARDESFILFRQNSQNEAYELIEKSCEDSACLAEELLKKLHEHVQILALSYKDNSLQTSQKLNSTISILSSFLIILYFISLYYIVLKIKEYKRQNNHLNGVLSTIREINRLIVREKDIKTLLLECCKVLTSKHIYSGAKVVLIDKEHKIEDILSSDNSQKFDLFKQSVKGGYIPECILAIENQQNEECYLIKNTQQSCKDKCILFDNYEKSSFTITLEHENRVYGYLGISSDIRYLSDEKEIALLKEVARDISYALYNISIENRLLKNEERYRFAIEASNDGIFDWDLVSNEVYFSKRFEEILGYSYFPLENSYEIWESKIYQDDLEQVLLTLSQSHNKIFEQFEFVYRLKHQEGHWVWLEAHGQTIFDKKNRPIRTIISNSDITQKHMLEIENRKFIDVLDRSVNELHVVDAKTYSYTYMNKAALNALGYTKEEIKSLTPVDTVDDIHSKEELEQMISKLINKEKAQLFFEVNHKRKDGTLYPVEAIVQIIDIDGVKQIVATVIDAQEKKQSQKELREALLEVEKKSKDLETIIQEAPNPMMLHNEDGVILLTNRVLNELSGYEHKEINTIQKWVNKAFDGDKFEIIKNIYKLYSINSKVDIGEYGIVAKDGTIMQWQFSSAPLGRIDGKRVVITSAMDITELKRKDEMLLMQSRLAAMGEMIGMIAHQWRQPISVISMVANNILLDVALDSFDQNNAQKYSDDILEQTNYLSKTIDDFRNFFKPDKAMTKVDINALLQETLSIVKDSLNSNSIKIEIQQTTQTQVVAYQRELMQVFVNLINNAKDALVENNIQNPKIDIKVFEDSEYLNVEICDNAGGVPNEILSKIFEPYFTTKSEKNGTGLGLYMSKMIIQEHLKGVLEVSNKALGASFMIRLKKERA